MIMSNKQCTSSKDMSCFFQGSGWQMWHTACQGPGSSSLDPSQSCWSWVHLEADTLNPSGRGGEWLCFQLLICIATELGTWCSRLTFPGIWRSKNQNNLSWKRPLRSPSSTSTTGFATKPYLWFACLTGLQMRIKLDNDLRMAAKRKSFHLWMFHLIYLFCSCLWRKGKNYRGALKLKYLNFPSFYCVRRDLSISCMANLLALNFKLGRSIWKDYKIIVILEIQGMNVNTKDTTPAHSVNRCIGKSCFHACDFSTVAPYPAMSPG